MARQGSRYIDVFGYDFCQHYRIALNVKALEYLAITSHRSGENEARV